MITLYDNAFSPFARKVRLVLEHKAAADALVHYEVVDGLSLQNRDRLAKVNGRVEVPVLVDETSGTPVTVSNSADIIDYVERRFPQAPVYPADLATFVRARTWERCADTVVDPILVDVSYWVWAERDDTMPDGLLQAAQADMQQVYDRLEAELEGGDFLCGDLSVADIALFPHLTGTRMLGVSHDADRHPRVHAWMKRLRAMPLFAADLERVRAYLANPGELDVERRKIFWRGDRIEWLLARGFHGWFMKEINEDRVLWPGLGLPAPRAR